MGFINDLAEGGAKGLFAGIGTLAKDIRSAITGKISPDEEAKIQQKLLELEFASQKAQTDINLVEANNPNLFVSGWRPAVGWTCVLGLFYEFLARPFLTWASDIWHFATPPALDMGDLMIILGSLLGFGGMRTFEKLKGVNRK